MSIDLGIWGNVKYKWEALEMLWYLGSCWPWSVGKRMQFFGENDFTLPKLVTSELLNYSCYACPLQYLSGWKLTQIYWWIWEFVGFQGLDLQNCLFLCFSPELVSSFQCFLQVLWAGIFFCHINISSFWYEGPALGQECLSYKAYLTFYYTISF